jgi:hypothetical protein
LSQLPQELHAAWIDGALQLAHGASMRVFCWLTCASRRRSFARAGLRCRRTRWQRRCR